MQIIFKKIFWWIITLIFVIIIFTSLRKCFKKVIMKNKKVSCVHVNKVEEYRTDYRIFYTIKIDDNYQDHTCLMPQKIIRDKQNIINRYFPILYDSTNFSFRVLIINKEQLMEWGLNESDWNFCAELK